MRGRVGWEWKGDGDGDDVVVGKGEGSSSYALKRQSATAGGVRRRAWGGGVIRDTGRAGVSWGAKGVDDDDLLCDGAAANDDDEMAMADVFLLSGRTTGGGGDPAMRSSSGGGQGAGRSCLTTAGRSQSRRARATVDAVGARLAWTARRVTFCRRPGRGGGAAQGEGEGEEVDRRPWTHQGGLGPLLVQ